MSINNPYSLTEAYYGVYADYFEEQVIDEALTGSRLRRANSRIAEINKKLQEPGNKNNPALLQQRSQLDRVSRSTEGSFDPVTTDTGLDFKGPRGRGGRGFKGGPKTVGAAGSLDRPSSNKTTQSVLKSIRRHSEKNKIAEGLDFYELVLDHLLDEGYVDSEDAAIQIMANMSEEWVDEIIEGFNEKGEFIRDPSLPPPQALPVRTPSTKAAKKVKFVKK